ncbi:MAG: FkbM family methyltransferase [Acidobacteriaceae bacterium]|nr:FkbM family methyltransferase [Acidobacteriaceae bacterium]
MISSLLSRVPRSWAEYGASRSRQIPWLQGIRNRILASLKNVEGVISKGPASGLRFNAGPSDSRFLLGTFEPAAQRILGRCLRAGDVFFDIGANVGFFSVLAARFVGPSGEIHAFEPLPANARQIANNVALNEFSQIEVHEIALSERDGTFAFRVSAVPTFGALSDSPMAVDQEIASVDVTVRALDSWMGENKARSPRLIKLDIEGSEVGFLKGAQETIEKCRPVLLIELHGTNEPVAAFFESRSYTVDIVGGGDLRTAPWAALAVAVPEELGETRISLRAICQEIESR